MAKQKKNTALRPGSQRAEVYNEGLCVYLYDEGNTDKLRKLIAKKGDPDEVFYENLSTPAVAKAVNAGGLAAAYELFQDDEVFVEVIVGPSLSDEELSASRWLPVQRTRLNLVSGRLRIDTANTMPLDPEVPDEPGAIVEVPPGDYVLSLYRVDWHACERDEVKYKGPGEVLVLTPSDEAEPLAKGGGPILSIPEPVEDVSWVGAYSIQGKAFECQINFWDYWEFLHINLDEAAVAELGLEVGSILRLKAAKLSFDLIYLDDLSRDEFLSRIGKSALEARIADRAEVGLGGWSEKNGRKVLGFFRGKASKAVPVKYHETWTAATGEILGEAFSLPEQAVLPESRRDGNTIRAAVAMANDDLLIVNVTEKQLARLGNTLKLDLPHGVHTVSFGEQDRAGMNVFLTGKGVPDGLHYLKAMGLRTFCREGKIPKKAEEFTLEIVPAVEKRPVVGFFPEASKDPLSRFLHIRPVYVDGEQVGFDWPGPPAVGTAVQLSGG